MIGLIILLGAAIVGAAFLICAGWMIGRYNTFVFAKQDVKQQWSNIKTEYQRRADLFFNIVETARGAMKFEKSTLTMIAQARSGYFGKDKKDELQSLGRLNTMFANLMGRVENYPTLKSIDTMNGVMNELKMTENRINIARTDYNETVRDYNILVTSFPAKFLAQPFGFTMEQFFDADPKTELAPKINFGEETRTDDEEPKQRKKKR